MKYRLSKTKFPYHRSSLTDFEPWSSPYYNFESKSMGPPSLRMGRNIFTYIFWVYIHAKTKSVWSIQRKTFSFLKMVKLWHRTIAMNRWFVSFTLIFSKRRWFLRVEVDGAKYTVRTYLLRVCLKFTNVKYGNS